MIQEFVDRFLSQEEAIKAKLAQAHPASYAALVRLVIEAVADPNGWDTPDPERIHTINDGDYQGTLVFVIGATGYQPSDYWYVRVYYGSCGGCDTLQRIQDYSWDEPPTEQQVKDYYTLALHIVQRLKAME